VNVSHNATTAVHTRRQFFSHAVRLAAFAGGGSVATSLLAACSPAAPAAPTPAAGAAAAPTAAPPAAAKPTTAAVAPTAAAAPSAAPAQATTAAAKPGNKVDLKGQPVAALFTSLNNDYYSSWDLGAKRAVEALGGKYLSFTNEGDAAREISQFEQQIAAGTKIFFITAPDPANVPQIAQSAKNAGVFFTNTHEMPPWSSALDFDEHYVAYFTLNNIEAGYVTAKALFAKMGGSGGLVHLSGHPGATPDWQRTAGLQQVLKENPSIELLGSQPGEWNRDDARKVMAGFITAQGAKIKGVFAQNDDVGIGAMNALEEAGMKGVPITGIDGNKETMNLIKQGRYFAAYSQFPFWQAGYSAVRAVDASLGWKPQVPERDMFTAGALITQDTADAYLKKFFDGPDPFDWHLMSQIEHPDDWDPQNHVVPMKLEDMWDDQPKPANWKKPQALADAEQNGTFDKMVNLYETRYQRKIFG